MDKTLLQVQMKEFWLDLKRPELLEDDNAKG